MLLSFEYNQPSFTGLLVSFYRLFFGSPAESLTWSVPPLGLSDKVCRELLRRFLSSFPRHIGLYHRFFFKICIRAREPKFDGTLKSVPKIKSVLKSVPLSALFYAEKQSKVHLDTFFRSKKIFFCNLSQNLIVQFFLPYFGHNVAPLLPTYLLPLQFFVIVCQLPV